MGTKKVKPQKVKGTVDLAGEKVKIGALESTISTSERDTKKAIKELTEKKIFPPPQYLND